MRRMWMKFEFKAVATGFLIAVITFFGALYTSTELLASAFVPFYGLAFFFAIVFGRRIYLALFLGFVAGMIGITMLWLARPVSVALGVSIFMGAALMLTIHGGALVFNRFGFFTLMRRNSLRSLVYITLLAVVMGVFAAFVHTVLVFLFISTSACYSRCFLINWFGYATNIAILTPLLLLSHYRREPYLFLTRELRIYVYTLFLVLFFVFSALVISGQGGLTFERHLYFSLLFMIVSAIFFPWILLTLHVFVLMLVYLIFHFDPGWATDVFLSETAYFMTSLYTFYLISYMLKRHIDFRRNQNIEIDRVNETFDRTLDYTNNFLRLSEDIVSSRFDYSGYVRETYRVASKMFEGADASFCYYDHLGKLIPLLATNYPVNGIPYFHELHDPLLFRKKGVIRITSIKTRLDNLYGSETVSKRHPELRHAARIYLVVKFNPERYCVIGFDFLDADKILGASFLTEMERFVQLFNKLFLRQFLSKQYLSMKDDIIHTFVRTLDLYDHYTKGHSEEVAGLCHKLALEMGIDDKLADEIYWAGLMHDIGKLGIDFDILNKTDKLTDEEYAHIKEHVSFSHSILMRAKGLETVATMVKDHHEKWDGTGYPAGLKGESISIGGQIIAVADAVATMNSDRPYRKRSSPKAIIAEIERCRGSQFAPAVADALIRLLKNDEAFLSTT